MKVGDLIHDLQYGFGIVIQTWKDTSFVHFYEVNRAGCIGHDIIREGHSVEIISEGR